VTKILIYHVTQVSVFLRKATCFGLEETVTRPLIQYLNNRQTAWYIWIHRF